MILFTAHLFGWSFFCPRNHQKHMLVQLDHFPRSGFSHTTDGLRMHQPKPLQCCSTTIPGLPFNRSGSSQKRRLFHGRNPMKTGVFYLHQWNMVYLYMIFWVDFYEILSKRKICEWDIFLNVTCFEKENHLNQITSIFWVQNVNFPECKLLRRNLWKECCMGRTEYLSTLIP